MDSISCRSPGCDIVSGSFSHHLAHHLGWRRRLLHSLMSSPPCRLISCRRPVLRLASARCLLGSSVLLIHHLIRHLIRISDNLLASRLASRPASRFSFRPSSRFSSRSPLGDVIAVLLDRSPCRSACSHRSPRPDCRLGWERDGTGLSRHRLFALLALLTCSERGASASVPIAAVCSACLGAAICVCIVLAKLYI